MAGHPIYLGAVLLCVGVSLWLRSGGGVFVVTPVLIAMMVSYIYGYEQPRLHERFGSAVREHQPLLSLTPATEQRASWPRKVLLALAVFLPWFLAGYLIDVARCGETCAGAFMTLVGARESLSWAVIWVVPYLFLALRLLASRTNREFRSAAIAAATAALACIYLYGVLPALGLDVRSSGWPLALISMVVVLGALAYRQIWDALRHLAERVANSRHDYLLGGGRFRIISHAIFAGLAGAAGVGIVGEVLGNGMAALVLVVFLLIGAAAFAQGLWANTTTLLRPFGYWGGVVGGAAGVIAVHVAFGYSLVRITLACVLAAPVVQGIGRLRCLAQGCCHGVETDPDLGIRVWQSQSRVVALSELRGRYILPTQLFSILFNVALGPLLIALYLSGGVSSTFIIGMYFVLTGIERFAEDAYRGEKQTRWDGPLRENQWLAIVAVMAGIVTTVIPSELPVRPAPVNWPELVLTMLIAGLATAFAMSMDFPRSTVRFSRLSG